MARRIALVLVLGVLLGATGCTLFTDRPIQDEGAIRITIRPSEMGSQAASPKVIPTIATKVRIRVWHPSTTYNRVATIALGGGGQSVDIPVPAGSGYSVDVVSYYGTNPALALTGGRAPNVTVMAGAPTSVQVSLQAWDCEVNGDPQVEPGKTYPLVFIPSDGGGLLTTKTLQTASLRTSTVSFQSTATPLPPFPGTYGVVQDDRLTLSGTAPSVTVPTTVYAVAMVEFSASWVDTQLPNQNERRLFIELPNRHTGNRIFQFTVAPASGGIVVDISSQRP